MGQRSVFSMFRNDLRRFVQKHACGTKWCDDNERIVAPRFNLFLFIRWCEKSGMRSFSGCQQSTLLQSSYPLHQLFKKPLRWFSVRLHVFSMFFTHKVFLWPSRRVITAIPFKDGSAICKRMTVLDEPLLLSYSANSRTSRERERVRRIVCSWYICDEFSCCFIYFLLDHYKGSSVFHHQIDYTSTRHWTLA